jgi:hypothetical protein
MASSRRKCPNFANLEGASAEKGQNLGGRPRCLWNSVGQKQKLWFMELLRTCVVTSRTRGTACVSSVWGIQCMLMYRSLNTHHIHMHEKGAQEPTQTSKGSDSGAKHSGLQGSWALFIVRYYNYQRTHNSESEPVSTLRWGPVIEVGSFLGTQQCLPPLIWGRKQIQFPNRCVI